MILVLCMWRNLPSDVVAVFISLQMGNWGSENLQNWPQTHNNYILDPGLDPGPLNTRPMFLTSNLHSLHTRFYCKFIFEKNNQESSLPLIKQKTEWQATKESSWAQHSTIVHVCVISIQFLNSTNIWDMIVIHRKIFVQRFS